VNQFETQKLKQFTGAIEKDAQCECEELLSDEQREKQSALLAAEDEILGEVFRFIKTESTREQTDMNRKISRHMMANKNKLNARREELGAIVMQKVLNRLEEYVKTEEYFSYLAETARDILNEFNHAETILYLKHDDMPLAPRLKKHLENERFTIEEGHFQIGGIMGTCPATHIQIDASFDAKYSELSGHFAEMFGLQLSQ